MKTISDAAFFRVFDTLVGDGNPGLTRAVWDYAAAHWERERLSVSRHTYSHVTEIITLAHAGRPKWTLLVVKEYWWGDREGDAFRTVRWTRPTDGRRAEILAWFRDQEKMIEARSAAASKAARLER